MRYQEGHWGRGGESRNWATGLGSLLRWVRVEYYCELLDICSILFEQVVHFLQELFQCVIRQVNNNTSRPGFLSFGSLPAQRKAGKVWRETASPGEGEKSEQKRKEKVSLCSRINNGFTHMQLRPFR
jgi:hypothetical protein